MYKKVFKVIFRKLFKGNTMYNVKENFDLLYDDDYCSLTKDHLKIKKYFFPSLKPKIILIKNIRIVYFDKQTDSKYAHRRIWGLAKSNNVYWAADFRRYLVQKNLNKFKI